MRGIGSAICKYLNVLRDELDTARFESYTSFMSGIAQIGNDVSEKQSAPVSHAQSPWTKGRCEFGDRVAISGAEPEFETRVPTLPRSCVSCSNLQATVHCQFGGHIGHKWKGAQVRHTCEDVRFDTNRFCVDQYWCTETNIEEKGRVYTTSN